MACGDGVRPRNMGPIYIYNPLTRFKQGLHHLSWPRPPQKEGMSQLLSQLLERGVEPAQRLGQFHQLVFGKLQTPQLAVFGAIWIHGGRCWAWMHRSELGDGSRTWLQKMQESSFFLVYTQGMKGMHMDSTDASWREDINCRDKNN